MYNNPAPTVALGAGMTAGGLAFTGIDALYFGMAAFALVAAGSAMKRMAPVVRGPQAKHRRTTLGL